MSGARAVTLSLFVLAAALAAAPAGAQDGSDTDDHWLAAACPITNGAQLARIAGTSRGPVVEFKSGRTGRIVLYCNVEPDTFSTSVGLWAEDDSPNGSVKATFFRQEVQDFDGGLSSELGTPEAMVTVISTDGPGVRGFQADFSPDPVAEEQYLYYIKITLERTDAGAVVRAYNVSQMVLF